MSLAGQLAVMLMAWGSRVGHAVVDAMHKAMLMGAVIVGVKLVLAVWYSTLY